MIYRLRTSILYVALVSSILAACNWSFNRLAAKDPSPSQTVEQATIQAYGTQLGFQNTAEMKPPTIAPTITLSSASDNFAGDATHTASEDICNRAAFLRDITVPDGANMPPGTDFTKIWELKNTGVCTWSEGYQAVFAGEGNSMSGPAAVSIAERAIAPGESVQIAIDLTAPPIAGTIRGFWKLRSDRGELFGLGSEGDKAFWVEINVTDAYNFGENFCSAQWTSGAGVLPCPGIEDDPNGYALLFASAELETGAIVEESSLILSPQNIPNGEIVGRFPPVPVPSGSHFRTEIGCFGDSPECDVNLYINYKLSGSSERLLGGEWTETHDGSMQSIDIDLDAQGLSGQQVSFIFYVWANQTSGENRSIWVNPRLAP